MNGPVRKSTKNRILTESLALFNEQSFADVTTAQIAAAAEIREGNLWYHFKAKRDLAFAHLEALEADLAEHLEAPIVSSIDETVNHFMKLIQTLWAYRYLMRDHLPALEEDADGATRLQRVFEAIEVRVKTRVKEAVKEGLLEIDDDAIEYLAVNAIIVARYWFDYVRARHGQQALTEAASDAGMFQLGSLMRPYLTAEGERMLSRIFSDAEAGEGD